MSSKRVRYTQRALFYFLRAFLGIFWIFACVPYLSAASKNVVLVIGRGVGASVLGVAADMFDHGTEKDRDVYWLRKVINEGHMGVLNSSSAGSPVSDPAAMGTALACGVETRNGRLAVDAKGRKIPTLFELCKKRGIRTGFVTTGSLTGPVPAAFSVHSKNAKRVRKTAVSQIRLGIDVLLGGGRADYGLRWAQKRGYRILTQSAELTDQGDGQTRWLGLFDDGEFPYVNDRTEFIPTLPDMTRAALSRFSSLPEGFFLVVECVGTDRAARANDFERLMAEFWEFDNALGVVVEFLVDRSDTTVFVTFGQEIGGLGFSKGTRAEPYPSLDQDNPWENVFWLSKTETAKPIFWMGLGPDGQSVKGWQKNADVFHRIKAALEL